MKKVLAFFLVLFSIQSGLTQDNKSAWVDSVFQTLSTSDRIGQLFMVTVDTDKDEDKADLISQIRNYKPGGLLVTGGGPVNTANFIKKIQAESEVPVLVGIEAAYGPGQVLDSLIKFQRPLQQGSITNDSLLFELGQTIAVQMRTLGIHLNFAPNADIDVIQKNYLDYLSDDKLRAARLAVSFMKGLQKGGVLSCAKHTDHTIEVAKDETQEEYMLDFSANRLDTLSFYPFQQLIDEGVDGILTSHLHFSFPDKRNAAPAPASQLFINEILKKQLAFEGLVFTDIPYLQTIAGKSKGEVEKIAFELGSDMLINPSNLNQAVKRIESGLKKNQKLRTQLEITVKKILAAKYEVGLHQHQHTIPATVVSKINSPTAKTLAEKLAEASITLAKNESGIIPIRTIDNKTFASLTVGISKTSTLETYLGKYAPFQHYYGSSLTEVQSLTEALVKFDVVVIKFEEEIDNRREIQGWVSEIATKTEVIICSFGNPYELLGLESLPTIVLGYSAAEPAPLVMAQVLFGATSAKGTLPITISPALSAGLGKPNSLLDRLGYAIPEAVGMDSKTLDKIQAIAWEAIDSAATPGCNIIIARKGKVIYEKAFGWQTYDKLKPMTDKTIHDLASITKVAATLQTVMFMHEKGLIDVNKKVSHYLPELKTSNKKDFLIKDILTHQAGLWPYLPFWLQTMQDSTLLPEYYSDKKSEEYPFPVSEKLFASKSMKDSLWHWIVEAKIRDKPPRKPYDYTYSDMGFYIMQHLAEKLLNQPMQDFLTQNLYDPLGAYTTGYLPLERFGPNQIAPTEVDLNFRKSKLVGYVHDQGAAMHGGIAGHAGLFSSGSDLIKLGQMWLQKGSYGGTQYFKAETIDYFTQKQYESSRRGLGWDKPLRSEWNGPTSMYASPATFGHTGFTGTAIWVDPEFDLVYVFLSNRVYPDMFNTKLLTGNIRPRIQDLIYQSIFEYCKQQN
ncbi:MAG: serine hydrolase [Cytophagales bacterium]